MKERIALVACAEGAPIRYLADMLREKGWKPFVLELSSRTDFMAEAEAVASSIGHIDLLVLDIEPGEAPDRATIRDGVATDSLVRAFDVCALGLYRAVDAFMGLIDKGDLKRICVRSSALGSLNANRETSGYGSCMAYAALNMGIAILFNRLRPRGYTFRVYDPEVPIPEGDSGRRVSAALLSYFLNDRFRDGHRSDRSDEDRLALRDWMGRETPW